MVVLAENINPQTYRIWSLTLNTRHYPDRGFFLECPVPPSGQEWDDIGYVSETGRKRRFSEEPSIQTWGEWPRCAGSSDMEQTNLSHEVLATWTVPGRGIWRSV